jgi:hypothetical protein
MPPHTPRPAAGDGRPRECGIADGGYGVPHTLPLLPRQAAPRRRASPSGIIRAELSGGDTCIALGSTALAAAPVLAILMAAGRDPVRHYTPIGGTYCAYWSARWARPRPATSPNGNHKFCAASATSRLARRFQ